MAKKKKTSPMPSMPSSFSLRMQSTSFNSTDPRLRDLWDAAINVQGLMSKPLIEAMVRCAFGSKQRPEAAELSVVVDAMKEADDTFDAETMRRELEVLCASILAEVLLESGENASFAALAICGAGIADLRSAEVPFELHTLAETTLARLSVERRPDTRNALGLKLPAPPSLKAVTAKLNEGVNGANISAAFKLFSDELLHFHSDLEQRWNTDAEAIRASVLSLEEEIQMLWWLLGERCWVLDTPFANVPSNASPLALAYDLFEMTQSLPGPQSVKALLSRAMKGPEATSIVSAANALNPDFARRIVQGNRPSPVTTPIHFAIERRLETGDHEAWVAGWSAASEIDVKRNLSAVDLGAGFYKERLYLCFETQ